MGFGSYTRGFKTGVPSSSKKTVRTPSYSSSSKTKSSSAPSSSSSTSRSGLTYSSFDNQYHPQSWFAPVANKSTQSKTQAIANYRPARVNPKSSSAGKLVSNTSAKGASYVKPTSANNPKSSALRGALNKTKAAGDKGAYSIKPPSGKTTVASRPSYGDKNKDGLPPTTTTTSGGSSGSRGSSGGGGSPIAAPVVPVAKPVTKSVSKAAPKPVTAKPSPQNTSGKQYTLHGRGKAGRFGRRRRWGPRAGLSMTPEMLSRIARQRIVNYR